MISCILLAAGLSARFGSPKALASFGCEMIIERIQRTLLHTKLSEIIVVVGAGADALSPHILKNNRIKSILNKNFSLGQTSSFKKGLTLLHPQTQGIMLLPVDMPLIKNKTIDFLMDTFLKEQPLILIPTYKGKNGHPPVFSNRLLDDFKNLKNEEPLSLFQHKYSGKVLKLPVADEGVILSFNTQKEFGHLVKKSNLERSLKPLFP